MRRAAAHPARAQATGQLAAQLTTALDEERLVDRLVAHPHHRIVWELEAQAAGDLLGRPEPLQPGRHLLAEGSRRQLDHLRAACDSTGPLVSPPGSVVRSATVRRHLTTHRRRRPPDPRCNRRAGGARQETQTDLFTFRQLQSRRSGQPAIGPGRNLRHPLEHADHTRRGAPDFSSDLSQRETLERRRRIARFCSMVRCGVICSSSVRSTKCHRLAGLLR